MESGRSYGMCRTFSHAVWESLVAKGYDARIVHSSDPDNNTHQYILVRESDEEVIVDPSIGQFIESYNRPFIGTRDELKKLVLDYSTTIINTKSKNNPLRSFQRIWGDESSG